MSGRRASPIGSTYSLTMSGRRASPIGSPSSENLPSDNFSKDQDRFLPIANVSRNMKKSLPTNAKISKEAKETVQECVSEFISFITGEASDKCQKEKRKTINGDDVLWAMTALGFQNYVGPLKIYLNKYRETEGDKNSMARLESHDLDSFPSTTTNEKGYGYTGSGSFNMGDINEFGDENAAKRGMATQLQHGFQW